MLNIDIFNVGANACSSLSFDGKLILVDCGYGSTGWYPSIHFNKKDIYALFITNYDEDHVRDFSDLSQFNNIHGIYINWNVHPDIIKHLKSDTGMGDGIDALVKWAKSVQATSGIVQDFSPLKIKTFSNHYSENCIYGFNDENNLSLAVIFSYFGFKIFFPGDLERAGMIRLLSDQNFVNEIQGIDVLIAPHHGRENGCCDEFFNALRFPPQLVIMSDKSIMHGTQEDTAAWYGSRVRGANVVGQSTQRKVLTTRNDGHIRIEVDLQGTWWVHTGVNHGHSAIFPGLLG